MHVRKLRSRVIIEAGRTQDQNMLEQQQKKKSSFFSWQIFVGLKASAKIASCQVTQSTIAGMEEI